DVRLVVVADEIAHCVGVALRPRVEVRADRVLVPACVVSAAEAAQEHGGKGRGSDCQQEPLHRSRVMRSGGREISFSPYTHASKKTRKGRYCALTPVIVPAADAPLPRKMPSVGRPERSTRTRAPG